MRGVSRHSGTKWNQARNQALCGKQSTFSNVSVSGTKWNQARNQALSLQTPIAFYIFHERTGTYYNTNKREVRPLENPIISIIRGARCSPRSTLAPAPLKLRSSSAPAPLPLRSRSAPAPLPLRSRSALAPVPLRSRSAPAPLSLSLRTRSALAPLSLPLRSRSTLAPLPLRFRSAPLPLSLRSRSAPAPLRQCVLGGRRKAGEEATPRSRYNALQE